MGFFIGMFFCNILMPVIMIMAGYMMYKHPPKDINGVLGYRTSMSMKNTDTWKFAHEYCGRLWLKSGILLLIPTIIVQLPFAQSGSNTVGVMSAVLETLQLMVLIGSVFVVEKALKSNFDNEGNRIKSYEGDK